MESSDSNDIDRDEEQMSQNTNSRPNSALVIVAGPTDVTGSRAIKLEYKEFPVKVQRSMACIV